MGDSIDDSATRTASCRSGGQELVKRAQGPTHFFADLSKKYRLCLYAALTLPRTLRASHLRRINNRRYGRPVVIGQRLKLDFSRVKPEEFERRRIAYQKDIQQAFFMGRHIHSTRKHVVAEGESLWELTRKQFHIPLWLLRQYNPDLDPDRLHPGMVILIPELAKV